MAHPGGRPLKFKSVTELQDKIDAYFAECDPHWIDIVTFDHRKDVDGKILYEEDLIESKRKHLTAQEPYTITGLALALDTTRETLLDYEARDEFSDTIKKAKMKCQNYTEKHLYNGKNATGAIFSLKNNYNWKDKTEQDITSGGEPIKTTLVEFIGTDDA